MSLFDVWRYPVDGVEFETYLTDPSVLTPEDAIVGLDWLERCWQVKRRHASRNAHDLLQWEMTMFGLDWRRNPALLPEEVMSRHKAWEHKVMVIKNAMSRSLERSRAQSVYNPVLTSWTRNLPRSETLTCLSAAGNCRA